MQQPRQITIRRDDVISANEKAYINTSRPIDEPGQCWRMMAKPRMIEIIKHSLDTHQHIRAHRETLYQLLTRLMQDQ